jgi:tRNA(His) guanylyltransferase
MGDDSFKSIGEYQRLLERFENTNDQLLLPDLFFILRVDAHRIGNNWGQLADYPFSIQFNKALRTTAKNLMMSGFRINYSYIHGDEISLLFDPLESANQRKRSRLITLLASYATAYFNQVSEYKVVFHAKLSELPTRTHVVDYFIWQRKASARNFLTRKIIQALEAKGVSPKEIDSRVSKLSEDERKKLLVELGYPEEDLSISDLYGYGLWWGDTSSNKAELVESTSLGANESEYCQTLERILYKPAPLFDEPSVVSVKTATSSLTKELSNTPPSNPEIKRKPIFRLDKK